MAWLIDTNIAIHLRDGDLATVDRIDALPVPPALSIVSRVELEGGVYANPQFTDKRRAALDVLLGTLVVIDFDEQTAQAYREIITSAGYSRPRILDRMIAATALAHNLTLITLNGRDFRDVAGLKIDAW